MGKPRIIVERSQPGHRNTQERSDIDFYQSDPPDGIPRVMHAQNDGIVGDDVAHTPTTGGHVHLPHQPPVRPFGGRATIVGSPMLMDETTYIPGFTVGDPR